MIKTPSKIKKQIVKMKVCLVGEPGVGKTRLIRQLTQAEGDLDDPTDEFEISVYCLDTAHAIMEVQLWDCSAHYH